MKDSNYLKERNAKSIWHPMAHPADSLNNPQPLLQRLRDAHFRCRWSSGR